MPKVKEINSLEDHIGYWLRSVSNRVSQAFAHKLASKDVAVAEWVVLRLLYGQKPLAPSTIAEQMGMTKGAVTKLTDRLIAKSLVIRAADLNDGRAQIISLTKKGEKLVPELAQLADQNEHECFSSLSAKDSKFLLHILRSLSTALAIKSIPTE